MEGVDYAFSNPSPTSLFQAGKRFAMRYVGPGSSSKLLTTAEAATITRAGLSLVLLVEGAAADAARGFALGQAHANSALAMCRARGFPVNRPMYFAVDYDVATTNWAGPREYLRGAGTVLGSGLVGVYGEYDVMVWASRDGVAQWFFQTYAWSAGKWFQGNHVEQYKNGVSLAGGVVDLCRSKQADFGQWGTAGEESDMLIRVTESGAIWTVDQARLWRRYISEEEAPTWKGVPTTAIHQGDLDKGWYGVDVRLAGSDGGGGSLAPHTHPVGQTGEAVATDK
jgi:Domain of unknown function (DUF1906)